jgi:hypothetical protein
MEETETKGNEKGGSQVVLSLCKKLCEYFVGTKLKLFCAQRPSIYAIPPS